MAKKVSMNQTTIRDGVNVGINQGGSSSFNSIEQFLSPLQIDKGHTGAATPAFRSPFTGGDEKSNEQDGALYGADSVGPTVSVLDPYFPEILGDDGSDWMQNNDYRIVFHNRGGDYNLQKFEQDGGDRGAISAVRINGLRGPLVMSGWGYGVDDMPVPADPNDNKRHDPRMANDRALWKTGPIHLPWDEERQVWASQHRIVCGVALSKISAPTTICDPTTFKLGIIRHDLEAVGNRKELGEEITITNRDPSLEQEYYENAVFVMAIKLAYEWLPLWGGCPDVKACGDEEEGEPPIPECLIDRCPA